MLKRSIKKVAPYSVLAEIYDRVMEHVDYERWARYVHKLVQLHNDSARTILDISCGTGTCAAHLLKYGYTVCGTDSSQAMIRQARNKALQRSLPIHYLCADMRRLPLKLKPDVVISLYDSMNYLMGDKDWRDCMDQVYRLLKPRGLFIFDVSTLYNSMHDFADYRQTEKIKEGSYVRESSFNRRTHVQKNYFKIKLNERPGIVYSETHRQLIRPLDLISSIVNRSPFSLVGGYKDFSLKPFTEQSERVHFVLKKAD